MINLENIDKFHLDDFIKDLFIGFYQALFYQNQGEFHYDPDMSKSRINVADQFNTDNLTPEFKPLIYIRRRPFSFARTTIDQMFSSDMMTGTTRYSDLISGNLEVVVVAREGLEACRLAGLVFLLTNAFKAQLRAKGLADLSVKSLGEEEPRIIGTSTRVVEVPVMIQVAYQFSWLIGNAESIVMNSIEIGKSNNPITGEPLVGVPSTGCNDETGVNVGDGMSEDGTTKICIPITLDSP